MRGSCRTTSGNAVHFVHVPEIGCPNRWLSIDPRGDLKRYESRAATDFFAALRLCARLPFKASRAKPQSRKERQEHGTCCRGCSVGRPDPSRVSLILEGTH